MILTYKNMNIDSSCVQMFEESEDEQTYTLKLYIEGRHDPVSLGVKKNDENYEHSHDQLLTIKRTLIYKFSGKTNTLLG